jgi:RNA polymerase sigma factor (sigma-70 family)
MNADQLTDLIRRHARLIHRIAYAYCRDATDREDIVQEVAMQLWRCRDRYDPRCRETTWIYRIALNVAISFHRRERRHQQRRSHVDTGAIAIAAAPEPGDDVQQLLRCIDDLGDLDKALVLLHLDDNDHASIADVLGLSVSNVGTRLARIRERLRARLQVRTSSTDDDIHDTAGNHGTR